MKLSICNDKIDDLTNTLRTKSDSLEYTEQKLDSAKLEADSLKIGLDEIRREKLNVQERLEMTLLEKASVERSRTNLQVPTKIISTWTRPRRLV